MIGASCRHCSSSATLLLRFSSSAIALTMFCNSRLLPAAPVSCGEAAAPHLLLMLHAENADRSFDHGRIETFWKADQLSFEIDSRENNLCIKEGDLPFPFWAIQSLPQQVVFYKRSYWQGRFDFNKSSIWSVVFLPGDRILRIAERSKQWSR
jgi:hypothetical protein